TCSVRPARSAARIMASAWATSTAIGFSTSTWQPAASARSVASRWATVGVATDTASHSASSASGESNTRPPCCFTTFAARPRSWSCTPTSSASRIAPYTRACFSPHTPTPQTPQRTGFTARLLVLSVAGLATRPGTVLSARDAAHAGLAEAGEMLGFGDPRQLMADRGHRLGDRGPVAEEDTVRAVDRVTGLAPDPAPLQAHGVDPGVPRRAARGLHERRDVLRHARAAADHAVPADARELVHDRAAADDRPVVHHDVAGELHRVRDHDPVPDGAVVRHVRVRHEEPVVADARGLARL